VTVLLRAQLSASYPGKPHVLRGVELEIQRGECLGLVGQSGSGKSTLALALLQLLGHQGGKVEGSVTWRGRELLGLGEREWRRVRGREMALVLQSAATALNPHVRIETQFREAWRAHSQEPWPLGRTRVCGLLREVGLEPAEPFLARYPREVSLGQAQRVLFALALLHEPGLLIADEPTSALDAITSRDVLDLMSRLARERDMSVLLISHDLASVATYAQRVAILHEGRIVEQGPPRELFSRPRHEYTQRLVAALPLPPAPVSATGLWNLGQAVGAASGRPEAESPAATPPHELMPRT
jgi:ABC-type glutathione transport system ATPase component